MERAALLSVYDKSGLSEFARGLNDLGFMLLATGGTARHLTENGIACTLVEEYTGQKEFLDGRVKTLHPMIHGGLLARHDNPQDLASLKESGITPITVAAVNLYPFEHHLKQETRYDVAAMVEYIDIGGPTMIRAAAKNWKFVYPVIDPSDYADVLKKLQNPAADDTHYRGTLAKKVFSNLAHYNLQIARYFSMLEFSDEKISYSEEETFADIEGSVLLKKQDLRYGENPHQQARLYTASAAIDLPWKQHQGKELSYNNLLDFDAASRTVAALPSERPGVVIIKHCNPCGAASDSSTVRALERARQSDPRSHFGGIVACNRKVERECAEAITEAFTEIVVAPEFDQKALEVFSKKKNLRVIELDVEKLPVFELRSAAGGYLLQENDRKLSEVKEAKHVAGPTLSAELKEDVQLAWSLVPHVRSNAIVCVKDQMLLATGGGQMSRIDALEVALMKAKTHSHSLRGAVVASDAFFPFPDCVEECAKAGISAIIVPAGSVKDEEVIAAAAENNITLLFTADRHFRH